MRFAELFRRPKRDAKVAHASEAALHEDHAKALQKEARRQWDVVGRNRHKNAKWQ